MKRRNDGCDSLSHVDSKRFHDEGTNDVLNPISNFDSQCLQVHQVFNRLEKNPNDSNKDNVGPDLNLQQKDDIGCCTNNVRISSVSADGSMKITISSSDHKNSHDFEGVSKDSVLKPCTNCLDHSFLICKGLHDDIVALIQSNPPKFIQDLNSFIKSNKVHGSFKVFCTNCSCGPMNDWKIFCEHLVGKSHKKNVKSESIMKILICSVCKNMKSYCIQEDNVPHIELPDDVTNIIKDIFPNAVQRVNTIKEETKDFPPSKEPFNLQKKLAHTVDMVFYGINRDYAFNHLFDDIANYAEENELKMQFLFVAQMSDQTAFCRFSRSNLNNDCCNFPNLVITGYYTIRTEVISSFQGNVARFRSMPNINRYEWSLGDLTPLCLGVIKRNGFFSFVNSKLNELENTSMKYEWLTRQISRDLFRAISGTYTVTSIHYFGSRVTGLAFSNSDFDLQISINEKCSVRALSNKCLRRSQLFTIKNVIPWARVPIIKAQHYSTGLMCDISLNNMNGVINSQLLKFYLEIDSRVKWLVAAVKLWANMNFIIGPFLFTSYTLAWLVLFFLMQDEIRLIPSVQVLTKLPCRRGECLHSEVTSTRFSLDFFELRKVHNPTVTCNLNNYQLLVKFFHFWLKVSGEGSKVALNTFTGEILSRKSLSEYLNTFPVEGNLSDKRKIFSYSFILIDPIKHSFNISAGVNSKLLTDLSRLCQETLQLF